MITSINNGSVKKVLQLQKKAKLRSKEGTFIIEGIRMFRETPKHLILKTYVSELFYNKHKEELQGEVECEVVSEAVFRHMADTKTPQGILCIVRQLNYEREQLVRESGNFLVILENLQDPGNLGTIIRTGEGAGITGVILSKDCADIYSPKVIRSTMGAIYRVPFVYAEDLEKTVAELKEENINIYAAHLEQSVSYDSIDYRKDCGIMIGNEGNGLSETLARAADAKIHIPMEGQVESLNAAVAAAIIMYESYRQRR